MLSVEGYVLKLAFGCEFNTAEAKMLSIQISLSFSYRASSIRVTISITNRCDFCFMSLFHISLLTLHVSGLYRSIIWGI
jgi:hypothetical protein